MVHGLLVVIHFNERETHLFENANVMVVAKVSCKGVASTHFVALSIHITTYLDGDVYTPS